MVTSGLVRPGVLEQKFSAGITESMQQFKQQLDVEEAAKVEEIVVEAKEMSQKLLERQFLGEA
eukprot:6037969-Karenia_brevis.AAC.1